MCCDRVVSPLLERIAGLRAVMVTGKGGVGKTTVTATLARLLAASGKRVLCGEIAADQETSSPLMAALTGEGTSAIEPVEVLPGIATVVLQPTRGHHAFLRDSLKIHVLANAAMRSQVIRRFLLAAPTFPELGILYRVLELERERLPGGRHVWDTILLDLPATGHALALAQIPASILRIIPGGPIVEAVREGLRVLRDPAQAGAVLVTLPETLPVSEALELAAGLVKHEIPLAGFVLNRVPVDPFDPGEREAVRAHAATVGPLLGMRSLDRIERARAALERLSRGISVPWITLAEAWEEGPALPVHLTEILGGDP